MRFGLKVNPAGWDEAAHWAGVAEAAGFDCLWTGDNLRHPRDPEIPVLDGPTVVTGWAATTSRIRVGLLVANLVFRHPTVLAKQAATMDQVSGGRFDFGIGSGLWPSDHSMAGVPMWTPRERTDRLAEFVAIVDRLLSGDVTDHSGAYYPYSLASMSPEAVRQPPLIVAANGPRALAVVAAHADGWATFPGAASEDEFYEESVRRNQSLDELLDGRAIRRILLAYGAINPWESQHGFAALVNRFARVGFDEIVVYAPKAHELQVFDQVVARLDDYR
ncbi:LLM class flavin-dependent oxidoreductase [Kribbella sancticallisti]|uniref:LLM class flavin-dependent oxidoreductase n=1 Tax=Kribbella sancticallisti TaxID=460087 RepID=A0ABP4PNI4_9ACTN